MSRIVIDQEKCKACYLCIKECPKNLIKVSDKTNKLFNSSISVKMFLRNRFERGDRIQ